MAKQQRESLKAVPAPPPRFILSDETFLRDPHAAFEKMRDGTDVVVEPTNGCARMHLSAILLSDIDLDE
jgi:hypothetical protein